MLTGMGTHFGALDWAIVAVYLILSVGAGLMVRKFIVSMENFVVAGRAVGTALGVATLTSSELGLITVMYSAQKGFTGGFASFHIAVVAALVTLAVGLSGFIVAPLRAQGVMTIPEYYERRYGRRTRILGGAILAFGGILNMGLFLKVEAMYVQTVMGLPGRGGMLTVMLVMLGLVLLYSLFGGTISDIVTDYIQYVVLAFGLILACFLAARYVGWQETFDTVAAVKGEAGFNPFLSESAFGMDYVLWMVFLGLVSCAIWPTSVSRALASESPAVVKRTYLISSIGFLTRFLLPYFLGICAFVWVMKNPGLKEAFFPLEPGVKAQDNLYALPLFLAHILPTGLAGLVLAGMLAALMSTYDTYLLTWSSVLTQDVVAPLMGEKISTKGRILLTRVLMVAVGLSMVYWGLFYKGGEDVWDYMAVTGAIYFTGAFALLAFGLYWKKASSTGAVLALLTGFSAVFGLAPVQRHFGFEIRSARLGLATVALACLAMVLGSLNFPDRPLTPTLSRGGRGRLKGGRKR